MGRPEMATMVMVCTSGFFLTILATITMPGQSSAEAVTFTDPFSGEMPQQQVSEWKRILQDEDPLHYDNENIQNYEDTNTEMEMPTKKFNGNLRMLKRGEGRIRMLKKAGGRIWMLKKAEGRIRMLKKSEGRV